MSYFVVDVEADGPYPGDYSIVCFGAVMVTPHLDRTFYGEMKPISDKFVPEALAISGFTREQHEKFREPESAMLPFLAWVKAVNGAGRPVFISDNNGFDWMFMCYYMHKYGGENPFGWSSRRIGDLYCGMKRDTNAGWKGLRKTKHNHHPVNDAMGNAEALLALQGMGLKINLK